MLKYGIVQGRLVEQSSSVFIQSFPIGWREEFRDAKELGVSHIEWIDGAPYVCGLLSPYVFTLSDLKQLPDELPISAVCCDWMPGAHSRLNSEIVSGRLLDETMRNVERLGIKKIVLPMLENASMLALWDPNVQKFSSEVENIRRLALAHPNIRISIESDLTHVGVAEMMRRLKGLNVGVTFDTGNLTKLGYDLNKHIDSYGDLIDNIHVKDCKVGGSTVELGTGDADLSVLKRLANSSNVDHVTFQTARSPGTCIDTYKHNCNIMKNII